MNVCALIECVCGSGNEVFFVVVFEPLRAVKESCVCG